jgi:hypothetical protein
MPHNLLRIVYVTEFLVAQLAVWTLWSQVGGQGHLDLMPWYAKLILSVSLSLVIVLGTAAAVNHERAWNLRTIVCMIAGICIAAGMGVLTYYYHLHEDEDNLDDDAQAAVMLVAPERHRL